MLNKNDDSSCSEDEISKDVLNEVRDHQFLKDSYFLNQNSDSSNISKETDEHNNLILNNESTNLVSLRNNLEQQDKSNFGVTPSFQSYVAKKLDEIIEKSIRIKKREVCNITNEEQQDNNYGIKLLNSSIDFLTSEEEIEKPQKKRKIETVIDEEKNLLKCKEVAIESRQILSKAETKAWTNKRKEPEFKYKKLKNGSLVEKT